MWVWSSLGWVEGLGLVRFRGSGFSEGLDSLGWV